MLTTHEYFFFCVEIERISRREMREIETQKKNARGMAAFPILLMSLRAGCRVI